MQPNFNPFATLAAAIVLTSQILSHQVYAESITVRSPNGKNSISIDGIANDSNALHLTVAREERAVFQISSFGIAIANHQPLGEASDCPGTSDVETVEYRFALPWGKTSEAVVRGNRTLLPLVSWGDRIQWQIELAAYDDGVAWRYHIPKQAKLSEVRITEERGHLHFRGNPTLHYTAMSKFTGSHEAEFQRDPLDQVYEPLIDLPLLAVWPDGQSAALTEARVLDFPHLYLSSISPSGSHMLRLTLSPLPDQDGICAVGEMPMTSPWRVALLGEHAGKLLESNLLLALNDPPSGDFSWVRPGKSTWQWWNGTFDNPPPGGPLMDFESHKSYIDFCAANHIEYHAVVADTRPWHVQSQEGYAPGPDTDILTPRHELELPRIIAYARERGVAIRLWLHWKALEPRLEEAFQKYEEWGISGLMVDFLDRDDQEMVRFEERVLASAARHKLHIQFHGSHKPTGEQRTYPNLFNREGVLNLEYLKWSNRCTPPHNVEAAYVRQLAGPMDYHTGGFRSVSARNFEARSVHPYVLGTRCHHLSMYVVYENPLPMVSDTPEAYEGQAGFDFIAQVPCTWDETRFVTGTPGDYIVMARRKGDTWYLGGMNNWTQRTIVVPLDFLGKDRYEARLYLDGSMDQEQPNAIRADKLKVSAGNPLQIEMASGGGFVGVLGPST